MKLRMRLSKAAWLILGIGILVIAMGSLYMVYLQQGREQQALNDSLSVAQATLPQLTTDRGEKESQLIQLEGELTQAESLLGEAKVKFSALVESIEHAEELFRIADGYDLVIAAFTSSEPRDEGIGDITYFVTSFTVKVEGEVADILDLINTIATSDYFTSATIKVVSMGIPEPLAEAELEGKGTEVEKPWAIINLVIYGYKGG